jgi:alkanesulfonate monooxygenase SsuD/methylene tetrahydromethanopterin reductase-like flavin-dependent oxidoreductase (luciferase family)
MDAMTEAVSGELVGVQTLQHGTTVEELARAWRHIDELCLASAWVMDHLFPMPYPSGRSTADGCFESWTLLSALAQTTGRVRVGCLVTANSFRNPVLLAKMATTVDHATGGRVVLGIGAGWYEPDHAGSGLPFPSTVERLDRLGEAIEMMRYCWSGADGGFAGRYYSAAPGLPSLPRPVRGTVPLLVGGNGERAMRLAARYADEWNMYAPTYEGFRRLSRSFDRYCAEAGRPPGSVRKTPHMPFTMAGTRAEVQERWRADFRGAANVADLVAAGSIVSGTVPEVVEQMQRYLSAGADGFILGYEPPYNLAALTLLAREVVPALQASHPA